MCDFFKEFRYLHELFQQDMEKTLSSFLQIHRFVFSDAHVGTEENLADILTKSLPKGKHHQLAKQLVFRSVRSGPMVNGPTVGPNIGDDSVKAPNIDTTCTGTVVDEVDPTERVVV